MAFVFVAVRMLVAEALVCCVRDNGRRRGREVPATFRRVIQSHAEYFHIFSDAEMTRPSNVLPSVLTCCVATLKHPCRNVSIVKQVMMKRQTRRSATLAWSWRELGSVLMLIKVPDSTKNVRSLMIFSWMCDRRVQVVQHLHEGWQ